mmetsp:Transcript_9602/g.20784  ORF Transcript_9602/g.20784 Transcript_9602/m.20784 type:complete len:401 (+) Transcript_9602:152-1354(+)|eukprot:CAMPEP_0168192798 /NCGR_PEP_ID=MMETSP0139_2-20121125/18242_1 /TAXON_ID=44445 /ORGANISM="Pseudo-nitzschia australis, Strain 10249 10 AB" /LENGTH=400 /DNA_ID=CAMNT_0008116065 /DNA_START=124 /DNA_END=1326 /DNA_ORIENTATION=+
MKYSISVVVALLGASSVNAFTAPRSSSARSVTSLDVTTLDQWQLLDNGSLVGSVQGHPTLADGDVITTSPLSRPDTARSSSMVSTLTGSQYQLGAPMQLGGSSMAPAGNEPGFGRSTFVKVAGTASLFAGGLALGVGVATGGIVGDKPVSISEAKIGMAFPGAVKNAELMKRVSERLAPYGYGKTTMVATSFCCDEVNRPLEKALAKQYDEPFVMGGLAGFPFGGITSFGAMAHHIPDGGSCLVVYGPHVGVDSFGSIGTVNRRGRAKGGACCGSAAAALGNVRKGAMVPKPGEAPAPAMIESLDAQQQWVNSALLPYGERLLSAGDQNIELPYALYDAQKKMMDGIVAKGAGAMEGNGYIATLGGIQINTPEETSDYFLPISFDLRNAQGKLVKSIMWA